MKRTKLLVVVAMVLALYLPNTVLATVVNFDDCHIGNSLDPGFGGGPYHYNSLLPSYAGLTWTWTQNGYWGVVDGPSYNAAHFNTTVFPSNNNAAFNMGQAITISMSSPGPINVIGAYFAYWALRDKTFQEQSAHNGASSSSVTIKGYLGGTSVGSVMLNLTSTFQYVALDFQNVDNLTFTNDGNPGDMWLMDKFEYNAVPLPPSVLLLGSGLLGLAGWRRFRKS